MICLALSWERESSEFVMFVIIFFLTQTSIKQFYVTLKLTFLQVFLQDVGTSPSEFWLVLVRSTGLI